MIDTRQTEVTWSLYRRVIHISNLSFERLSLFKNIGLNLIESNKIKKAVARDSFELL